jgi:hypothetical protein
MALSSERLKNDFGEDDEAMLQVFEKENEHFLYPEHPKRDLDEVA